MIRVPRRYRGFLDDDGSIQWWSVRNHLRSRWAVFVMRLDNRLQDARARLLGACNASTWTGRGWTGYAGGYSHWRCGKARGHEPPHRFNNYTWTGRPEDRTQYDPLPIRNADNTGWYDSSSDIPFRKLAEGRRAVDSRRRGRISARLMKEARERPRQIPNPWAVAAPDDLD